MHLYRRKDSKYWWYKFEYQGVIYRASTGLKNKPEARNIASKARLDVIEGKYDIKRRKATPLFKNAMASFLDHVRQHNAPNTATRYEAAAKPLNVAFGEKQLTAVTADAMERYKTARLGEKLKPATVNAELRCAKAMFNHFIRLDKIASSPIARVKMLPENNEQMRVLNFEEERLYLAACPQPLHDIAVLMLDVGMRPEELYRLRRENVNLEAGWVFNPYGKSKAARRTLSLTRRAAEALKGRLAAAEGDYVFPLDGDPSKPMGKANNFHNAALKRSGVPHFRLYDLRHTFATRAAESGVDLVTLAALLGHSKIQMVMRYAHPQAEHKAQAIRKMEEFQAAKQMAETNTSELIQ
jgi:integrase